MSVGMVQKEQFIRTLTDGSIHPVTEKPLAVINKILLCQCVV
jgi:hypothetical protein